ncbi:hypothetical protein LCGC14_2887790 [marine sediment metagenome]|uniref:Uncharacterized protein n=1 Tax=marine sediment metagenome TaxID=412755 RepID=A0A0F9AP99_9ZZZZ
MVKKVVKKKKNTSTFSKMSFSDLYAMYLFVASDASRMFGHNASGARKIVLGKEKEIREMLYKKVYGFNPFEKFKTVIVGKKPEEIDLDKFIVLNKIEGKPKNEETQTFASFPNLSAEEKDSK